MRWVSTRVLPRQATATMSRGEPEWTTAARWFSFNPSRRAAESTAGRGAPSR
ncbi:hypothetical protein SGLAM104S_10497 [Streptomyces glaucescens]